MQVYFIGQTNQKGTYYFHSQQHNGWVVADLDNRLSSLHDCLAVIELIPGKGGDAEDELLFNQGVGLGQNDNRWLVDVNALCVLLRDYPDEINVLSINNQDGTITVGGKDYQDFAELLRKMKEVAG